MWYWSLSTFSFSSFFPFLSLSPLSLVTWLRGDALYDNPSCQRNRTISHSRHHFAACVRLKREKSRLGFIIPTIARSAVQSTILLPFHSSYPSSPETPAFVSRIAQFPSFPPTPTLNSPVFLKPKTIYVSMLLASHSPFPPFRPPPTADARIIAAKPCYKAVPYHKGLFNPWMRRKRRIGMRMPPASLSNILLSSPPHLAQYPHSKTSQTSLFQS